MDTDRLIKAVLAAADPAAAVRRRWVPVDRVTLVAAGKASRLMAEAAAALCGDVLRGGVVAMLPDQIAQTDLPEAMRVYPAAHPLPDERNLAAARAIERTAQALTADDTLLLLLSGGGSAHLAYPAGDLTLADIRQVSQALMQAGSSIDELNTVRKACEVLKGGGLARIAHPARIVALILSDVVGDRLDVIASGPVVANSTTPQDALDVLARYDISHQAISTHLKAASPPPPTPEAETHIIASNRHAVEALREALTPAYTVRNVREDVTGEARQVGRWLAEQAQSLEAGEAIIMGGETTVTVTGDGKGGRNQEVALAAAIEIDGIQGLRLTTFATDGIDGPTDASGAVIDGATCAAIRAAGIDPAAALLHNDSYTALAAADALLRTGATGTNVNDVAVLLAE